MGIQPQPSWRSIHVYFMHSRPRRTREGLHARLLHSAMSANPRPVRSSSTARSGYPACRWRALLGVMAHGAGGNGHPFGGAPQLLAAR
jgi:hypothetical protein